jgi:hypothetical protein
MPSFTIIEPMSTGDVIDRAVRLYRRNFAALIGVMAVPSLIGYISSIMFLSGYARVLVAVEPGSAANVPAYAYLLLILGGAGYPVWLFTFLLAVAGLARAVGDQVMLGEPITFRGCVSAVRHRLGDITLMGMLMLVVMVMLYIAFTVILFALIMVVGAVAALTAASGMPPWVVTVMMVASVVVAAGLGVVAMLFIVVRFVFMPQVVMIEGQSAGSALGRAMRLGQANWHRFGAVLLFYYFISLSLVAALQLPFMVVLYFLGIGPAEIILNPAWNAVYTGFNQIASLLAWPILLVALTLLYFDSRVRKEAYDLELLAREISPGFYWQPAVVPTAFGYQAPVTQAQDRPYTQTSPLGLAGYVPAAEPLAVAAQPAPADQAATDPVDGGPIDAGALDGGACAACGAALAPDARFCMRCGMAVS